MAIGFAQGEFWIIYPKGRGIMWSIWGWRSRIS